MLGVYNYTVIATYVEMFFSYAGILLILRGDFKGALLCLMISGVLDMFDGAIASTKKNRSDDEKLFGIQIDSMCDLICYGVLPAIFVCKINGFHTVIDIVCALYLLCALIRLSFFNVDEANRQNEQGEEKRMFYAGMPVTMIAMFLPLIYIAAKLFSRNADAGIFDYRAETWSCGLLAVTGITFITPIKLPKAHFIGKILLIVLGLAEFFYLLFIK